MFCIKYSYNDGANLHADLCRFLKDRRELADTIRKWTGGSGVAVVYNKQTHYWTAWSGPTTYVRFRAFRLVPITTATQRELGLNK